MKFKTIQKVANESGLGESTIRKMIKQKQITPYRLKGHSRIFIDDTEIEKRIEPVEKSVNLDKFLV